MRVTKTVAGQTTDIDAEVDQATCDTFAELLASDTSARNYLSGTIGFVTGGPTGHSDPMAGNQFVLWRECPFPPNGTTIFAATPQAGGTPGCWVLMGATIPVPGSLVMFAGGSAPELGGVTAFGPGGSAPLFTEGSSVAFVAPRDGTLQDFRVSIESALGGFNNAQTGTPFSVTKNGEPTGLTVTLPAGDADAKLVDGTHTMAVTAGDQINLVGDFTGRGAEVLNFSLSCELA